MSKDKKPVPYPEPDVMDLAEASDLSPNHARDLLEKHGDIEAAKKAAANFKAES